MIPLLLAQAHALEQAEPYEIAFDLAEIAVVAEVIDAEPRWSERHPGDVETVVWLATEQVLKGQAHPLVEVIVEGGRIGAIHTGVSGQPELSVGHRYQLLLVDDFDGNRRVIGPSGALHLAPVGPLAWTTTDNDWSWEPTPVSEGFELNADSFPDPVGTAEVFQLTLDLWNSEGMARVYLPNVGLTDSTQYGGFDDGHQITKLSAITFSTALAQSRYRSDGPDMLDCDTEFYAANVYGSKDWHVGTDPAPSGWFDFTHTAVHELGHCLGFGHSEDEDAVMYPSNVSGTGWERRHLAADDVAGLQAMYGAGAPELVIEDVAFEPAVPGDVVDIEVTVKNTGGAPSVDVLGALSASGATVSVGADELGDLPPGASRGTVADVLSFQVELPADCEGDAQLSIEVGDLAGTVGQGSATIPLDCGKRPGDHPAGADASPEEAAGCGCHTAPVGGAWVWITGLLLAVRRYRKRR